MDLDVYTQILMYISLSCHVDGDLAVLSLFNRHNNDKAQYFLCICGWQVEAFLTDKP